MDLETVRKKFGDGVYRDDMAFARDMRLIWNNCKKYNSRGSSIWFSADLLSKMFERLFHSWVVEFKDRGWKLESAYVSRATPSYLVVICTQASPWEQSCQLCHTNTEEESPIILCDHCDAQYHLHCLRPKLDEIPSGAWLCPVCIHEPHRMQSAAIEECVRETMEHADQPTVPKRVVEFLVKWQNASYAECTWETMEDLNNDPKAIEYASTQQDPGKQVFEATVPFKDIKAELSKRRITAPSLIPRPHYSEGTLPSPNMDPSWLCPSDFPVELPHEYTSVFETGKTNLEHQVFAQVKRSLAFLTTVSPVPP